MPLLSTLLQMDSGYYNYGTSPVTGTGAAASFVYTSNQYLRTPGSVDFAPGTGNFTIEWFQYLTTVGSYPRVFSVGAYPNCSVGVSIEGGTLYVWLASAYRLSVSLTSYTNVWIHFAIVRNGTSLVLYRNGTSIASTTNSSNITNSSSQLNIGSEGTTTTDASYGGYLSNFRWTNSAVYTSNFTKPTAPLAPLPDTKLLLRFSSAGSLLTDSSGTGKTVTNVNSVSWINSNPF